jgi:tetratricopeptide (TPR) repeat protein
VFNYAQTPAYILDTDQEISYLETSLSINNNERIELVVIQHEFGFFSKNEAFFKMFYDNILKPIVFVFHTVLPSPNDKLLLSIQDMSTAAARYKKSAEIQYKAPLIYALAANALRKDGKKAEAKEILVAGRVKYPNDKDILLELVNSDIEAGDNAAAEKSLADAIAADPNNKQLYLTIGTIYIELKQDEKAETALNKALQIDPNYTDAQYQLGALLHGIGRNLSQEASQLNQGDKNYEKMLAQADEFYKKAIVPLEAYIAKNPNDKQVLIVLAQIYRSLKNPEKSAEYKKRADAL